MKRRTIILVAILMATSVLAEAALPKGFITYSKGRNGNRTLHMVTLAPGMSEEQVRATETLICAKGGKGGDIQGQISFDGKMLAFARGLGGHDDYHRFDNWDVYVVRLDGAFPAKPVRVARGYWPSWGTDSTGTPKTLYFSTHKNKVGAIHKATIAQDGSASSITKHADLDPNRYEGFAMASPDGTFAAARYGGGIKAIHFNGKLAGRTIGIGGGCMPHVTADSQWVYNAIRNVARADGKAKGNPKGGGMYHYGSSPDMKWFVTKSTGGVHQQNDGGKVLLCALTATETSFELEPRMTVSDLGSWVDVHTDSKLSPDPKASRSDITPTNPDGKVFVWEDNKAANHLFDADNDVLRSCAVMAKGRSRIGMHYTMDCRGGPFLTLKSSEPLLDECKARSLYA